MVFMSQIRGAVVEDAEQICDIYNYYVLNSLVTFDLNPTDIEFWKQKINHLHIKKLPFLVLVEEGRVIGFAYCAPFREKAAYDATVESTIYIHKEHLGNRHGKVLFEELLHEAKKAEVKQVLAVISAEGAEASIRLTEQLGFTEKGRLSDVGYKFDKWLSIVIMQKSL